MVRRAGLSDRTGARASRDRSRSVVRRQSLWGTTPPMAAAIDPPIRKVEGSCGGCSSQESSVWLRPTELLRFLEGAERAFGGLAPLSGRRSGLTRRRGVAEEGGRSAALVRVGPRSGCHGPRSNGKGSSVIAAATRARAAADAGTTCAKWSARAAVPNDIVRARGESCRPAALISSAASRLRVSVVPTRRTGGPQRRGELRTATDLAAAPRLQ